MDYRSRREVFHIAPLAGAAEEAIHGARPSPAQGRRGRFGLTLGKEQAVARSIEVSSGLVEGQLWNLGTVRGRAALNAEITRQASVIADADDFKLMMAIALAAAPFVFLLRRTTAAEAEAVLE
jgi:hypothetical protein